MEVKVFFFFTVVVVVSLRLLVIYDERLVVFDCILLSCINTLGLNSIVPLTSFAYYQAECITHKVFQKSIFFVCLFVMENEFK